MSVFLHSQYDNRVFLASVQWSIVARLFETYTAVSRTSKPTPADMLRAVAEMESDSMGHGSEYEHFGRHIEADFCRRVIFQSNEVQKITQASGSFRSFRPVAPTVDETLYILHNWSSWTADGAPDFEVWRQWEARLERMNGE